MKAICVLIAAFFGVTSAGMLTGVFLPGYGFKITYTWYPSYVNSALQNLTIWRNGELILIYKPSEVGNQLTKNVTLENVNLSADCQLNVTNQHGTCVILTESLFNSTADKYTAEVSWGPPYWERTKEEETIIDPATRSIIRESQKPGERQVLNCSSEGVPAPSLVWTTGEGKNVKEIPEDFNQTSWDKGTKLWRTYSIFKPTDAKILKIQCTPKQMKDGKPVLGTSDSHGVNSADSVFSNTGVLAILLLLCSYTTMGL